MPKPSAAKLHPKEHGAYAILGIPIVAALISGGPTVAGVCIAVAAVAGFLAHEPLLVVSGHRGGRAQRDTPQAKSLLSALLLIAVVAGCIAMVAGSQSVRITLAACLVLAASSLAVALVGHHRTLSGQLWGVAGLSLPSAAILMAGGASATAALTMWSVWLLGFTATTIAVRSVIAAQKRQPRFLHTMILALVTITIAVSASLGAAWTLVTLPMVGLSWYLLIAPVPAKHLKRVGWTLVAGTVMTATLLNTTMVAF